MAKNKNTVVELVETTTEIEAPYELPEGWKWSKLGDFINIFRGVSYKKEDAHTEKLKNDCLIMRGGNIVEGNIDLESDNVYVDKSLVSENQYIKNNDVIIVTSTGSSKVIGRAGISYADYSDVAFGAFLTLARPNALAYKPYINQYFQSSLYRERIRELASGVNINNIRTDYITNSPIPIPPTLEEQQRIVNRIETQFAKLDEAKEKAQNVVDTFETRKASILHKAFTGELTRKWREENGVGDDSWEEKTGENIFSYITSGSRGWASYYSDAGEMFIRMGNLNHGTIDLELSNIQYVDLPDSVEGTRSQLKEKDILISITADLGMIGLVRKLNTNAYINQHIALARPSSEVNAEFIAWELVSDIGFSQLQGNKKGSTKIGLGLSDIKNLRLLVPTLPEQTEILLILDKVFEKETKAKESAITVLEQIDLLKKSILARAFRGEL